MLNIQIPAHLIISFVGVFQMLFLSSFLLFNKKTRNIGNLILAGIMFLLSIQIISMFTISVGVWQYFIHYHKYIFFFFQFSLLIAPLVYFYIRSLFSNGFAFKKIHIIHFLPFIMFVTFSVFYLNQYKSFTILSSPLRFYSALILVTQNLIYLVFISLILKKNKQKNNVSSIKNGNYRSTLLKMVISGLFLIWITNLNMFIIIDVLKKNSWCPYTTNIYFCSLFIFMNVFLFFLLSNPSLLLRKYEKSRLEEKVKDILFDKLVQFMHQQKPYLNPKISLTDLSNLLSVPIRDLSQVINEKTGQSFYDFINEYRIEESKRLLKTYSRKEKYISEIFYSVGFKSKSTFNTVFKKITGFTPGEFQSLHS